MSSVSVLMCSSQSTQMPTHMRGGCVQHTVPVVQGANYIRDGPQPLGAVSNGCTQAAWAPADVLHVTKSGCVVAWKHETETLTPNKDTGEAASDPTWDPDQATVAATSDSASADSDASG